jgi:hypothetical protein
VKRRDGRRIARRSFHQALDAIAHLARRFVGEGDGENRPARHAVRGHQVGDAMGDDAGLSAPRTGQDQQRAFGVLHCLALARVQPVEEIHYGDSALCFARRGRKLNFNMVSKS